MKSDASEVRERLPFGWTPSPAYPGRLGVAGSVLIETKVRLNFFGRSLRCVTTNLVSLPHQLRLITPHVIKGPYL